MSTIAIPSLHPSSRGKVNGTATVHIESRTADGHQGIFSITCDSIDYFASANEYPIGTVKLNVDLSESPKASIASTSIELINSHGHYNPTIFLSGRCKVTLADSKLPKPKGCKYWIMIADNGPARSKQQQKIVAFAVVDQSNNMFAYGAGATTDVDLKVGAAY